MDFTVVPAIVRHICATEIMPYYQNLSADQIQAKNIAIEEFVTIADLAAEKALGEQLKPFFPNVDFVGEESFLERGGHPLVNGFICDPIDGTVYFKSGEPTFGMMLAFLAEGEIVYALIYQPCTGDMMIAQKGQGVTLNGQIVFPKPRRSLQDQIMVGHFGRFTSDKMQPLLANIESNHFSLGQHICASMDYLRFAKGEIDNIVYQNAKPWDMAAGAFLVKELGGHAALLYDELDLTTHVFADSEQTTLFSRDRDDWMDLKKLLLN